MDGVAITSSVLKAILTDGARGETGIRAGEKVMSNGVLTEYIPFRVINNAYEYMRIDTDGRFGYDTAGSAGANFRVNSTAVFGEVDNSNYLLFGYVNPFSANEGGSATTSTTTYIDFVNNASDNNYRARIMGYGGSNTAAASGVMRFEASEYHFEGGIVGVGIVNPTAGCLHLYEATGSTGSPNTGTLILEHGNQGGHSSIVFPSRSNYGSDYGYIRYMDDVSNSSSSELSRLVIGIENDGGSSGDDIALMPSGGVGINTLTPSSSYKLDVNGAIQGTSFNASSDRRLKTNIVAISNALSMVNRLRGVSFQWNKKPGKKIFGVIAQEVEEVIPELVHTNETENEDGFKQKSIHYDGITPYLIEAIKTLTHQQTDLKQEVETLRRENKLLKEKMDKYDALFEQLSNK